MCGPVSFGCSKFPWQNPVRVVWRRAFFVCVLVAAGLPPTLPTALVAQEDTQDGVAESHVDRTFLDRHCFECHDDIAEKGGLNLLDLPFHPEERENFERWVRVYDQLQLGVMPPQDKPRPDSARFLAHLGKALKAADLKRRETHGRAQVRRMNRLEFEHTLQEMLDAPWLLVAHRLPEDGTAHLFPKSGERLDVSHVQITKFLAASEYAVLTAINTAAFPTETKRFHIRDEPGPVRYIWYRPLQRAATRAAIPLLGTTPQLGVIHKTDPLTVGAADPETRDREALGFFSGTFAATTKYDFTRMKPPIDGRYRLRVKSYTFMAGPNGASGGDDNGLTGGSVAWWRPNRNVAFPGKRSEPVTLYALSPGGDSRWLTTYDARPDPEVIEREVVLKKGEGIRPDAARLVRTRPGWKGNPNATRDGVPGFALCWLEVEGPLHDAWPPPSYRALFDDLPFEVTEEGNIRALTDAPDEDARRLIDRFAKRAWRKAGDIEPFLALYHEARTLNNNFTDAMVTAFSAMLCSPSFLYFETRAGPLENKALAARLSYFLQNGPPDAALENADLADPNVLRKHTDQLLNDSRSERFTDAFLDYWLDLRDLNTNAPDAGLYPDYYLDDLLTESSLRETRLFFRELIAKDLPTRHLVNSDFVFVNERLAKHYGLPVFEGVEPRRVKLPSGSPRGGLMTQASVLRVTANGTTTSPVLRGVWIMERLLGVEIPPPPSGISAVEPDTRGATTIREQLDKHRADPSCATCHKTIDPPGFALESFDIAGGWRERYRALDEAKKEKPVEGFGKNGHRFTFHLGQPVDCSGQLADGRAFADIKELKKFLLEDERQIARNLVRRLIVYATGAPVSFADRETVEEILDRAAPKEFGVRTLIHEIVQSEVFRIK